MRLLLPVPSPAQPEAAAAQEAARVKPRILVVDDEPPQLEILRLILGSEGYEAVTAASGRGALAALRRQPFDVVLTDLKMPDLSGIALLEQILREQPGACVVLMTAHGTIDSAVEAMRKGAFDYLTKPVDREVLLLAVSRAVERTRLVEREPEAAGGASGALPGREPGGRPREHAGGLPHRAQGGALELHRAHLRGERHGQGAGGARHPRDQRPARPAVRRRSTWPRSPRRILEAELFGYEKGAFTGADARKIGLFEQATARRSSSTRSAS